MAADGAVARDELARQAEKHLRQGRTDLALELYERLAQLAPTDWNAVKQLADLLERAGHREAAAGRFLQCADHHFEEGFHPKAAALYRKVLKLEPQSEHALWQLAEVSLALKLKADARQAFGQVLSLRQRRGDAEAIEAVSRRLAELEPEDARNRQAAPAAAPPAPGPSPEEVTERLRQVARDAEARGDADGAVRAWLAVLHRDPADRALRGRLLGMCLDRQDVDTARGLVEPLGDDGAEDVAWRFEVALVGGQGDVALALAGRLAGSGAPQAVDVHEVREVLRTRHASLADAWCVRVVDALVEQGRAAEAAAFIERAESRHPLPVDCHMRWVELCVDAGLDGLDRAQQALASAYLRGGQPELARAVGDDLLLRRPDSESIRSLALSVHAACGEPDPERSVQALLVPPNAASWMTMAEGDVVAPPADVPAYEPLPEALATEVDPPHAPSPGTPELLGVPELLVSPEAPQTDLSQWFASMATPEPPPLTARAEPAVPEVAAFDWGALLGREAAPALEPAIPAAVSDPVGLPIVDPLEEADDVDPFSAFAAAAPDDNEIDLTELLEELRPHQGPVMPGPAPEPLPPTPTPPDASRPPDDTTESVDAVDAGAAAGALPGVLAAQQQVAAGRVFAAAGLAAEAARAFERASRDVRSRFEAAEALAELHRSRGQLAEAVRWYDEAAHAPVPDAAVRRPVLYDLAETLEAVGQPDRALAVLLDLLSEVEDYRDARARADRLLRVDAGG